MSITMKLFMMVIMISVLSILIMVVLCPHKVVEDLLDINQEDGILEEMTGLTEA